MQNRTIKTALISVYSKDGLDKIVKLLAGLGMKIYSTGGTYDFIKNLGVLVTSVEELTGFPSIFDGRVKTLHPAVEGGLLKIRGNEKHEEEALRHKIPEIDLVIIDLYPFEETLASGASEEEIIEKIDIGGPTMIRAAAKNFKDVVVVPSKNQYEYLTKILKDSNETTLEQRKYLAGCAFEVTSSYDFVINGYFNSNAIRYGENPHQKGTFVGNLDTAFEKLQGKGLSYNNLLDTDAAVRLIRDFPVPCFAILKHTNACGCATGNEDGVALLRKAYEADPISAYGGIFVTNKEFTHKMAVYLVEEIKLYFEVLIAPSFEHEALEVLKKKNNLRILKLKNFTTKTPEIRTCLTGFLVQDKDDRIESKKNFTTVTKKEPTEKEISDMIIGATIAKHLKSNCVVIVKDGNMIAMGAGQVSRVDALKNALDKAKGFGFDVKGAILASEAFFPKPDCVEIAGKAGITAVVQPGGSIQDEQSIYVANALGMAMVVTEVRHFKH